MRETAFAKNILCIPMLSVLRKCVKTLMEGNYNNNKILEFTKEFHFVYCNAIHFYVSKIFYKSIFNHGMYYKTPSNFFRSVQYFCRKYGFFCWLSKQSRCSGFSGQSKVFPIEDQIVLTVTIYPLVEGCFQDKHCIP